MSKKSSVKPNETKLNTDLEEYKKRSRQIKLVREFENLEAFLIERIKNEVRGEKSIS